MQTADTLAFLLGSWELTRSIEDHRSDTEGLFQGTATLVGGAPTEAAAGAAIARYEESGELRFGSRLTRASRSLLYERLDTGSVMLHFADGNPFVELNLQSGEWISVHHCRADLYELNTRLLSENVIQERWSVTGPSKDYVALTTLTRIA